MRLFFAIWPDEPVRAKLGEIGAAVAVRVQGKPVPPSKLHITLAFLGEVPEARLHDAREAAMAARASRFQLDFDEVGSFRSAHVAWAGCSRVPPGLGALQSSLADGLRRRGFALEERSFAAHVTLARKISKPIAREPVPAIGWSVHDFALIRSETGRGTYSVLERWGLEGNRSGE